MFLPVVADPKTTEVNRAQLSYKAGDTNITVGRQRIILDTASFVGNVGFRQNEQTFDAIQLVNTSIDGLKASYIYINKVHRIFGDDHPAGNFTGDTHLANVSFTKLPFATVTGYGYWVDTKQAAALSTKTFGVRAAGNKSINGSSRVTYAAEFAHQNDSATNPFNFSLDYYTVEAGFVVGTFNVKAGLEVLEGNGTRGFATPLATLHKFQGFADVFLATPANE